MYMLAFSVTLWSAIHFLPAVAPGFRDELADRLGAKPYRAAFSITMLIALVLMIWGYRSAEFIPVYDPPSWGVHLNNLLVLFAVYLFGAGGAKAWIATKLRHPMLTGVAVWAVAHLLVNGDQASVLLFGGMLLWALAEIFMINRRTRVWVPPKRGGVAGEVKLVLISLAIYAVIAFTHGWLLGVNPFVG
jgi:uncharacterized membrane protein